jgi:CelD/BcsL family acetyltransferase involved in cellulose biosynthesis
LEHLARRGNSVYREAGVNCWRLALPKSWDQYLAMLSKSHRKQLRRLDRNFFRSGRAVMHWVHRPEELEHSLDILVDLHQRHWRKRRQTGCFASPRFLEFHREVTARMLAENCLLMSWLELDGRAAAAEYHLAGAGVVYAYQSGIAPECLEHEPGRLSNLATIKRAIERGDQFFDFLRGDEPYKAHWRAVPRPTFEACVVPGRVGARLRHGFQAAGGNMMQWIKSGWHFAGNLVNP